MGTSHVKKETVQLFITVGQINAGAQQLQTESLGLFKT